MKNDDNRNLFIFIALSVAILFVYQVFVVNPQVEKAKAKAKLIEQTQKAPAQSATPSVVTVNSNLPREEALKQTPRVQIDTPSLKGSISLVGSRIDDLYLAKYRLTTDPKSAQVELLRPKGAEHAFYVYSGFIGQNLPNLPGDLSTWTLKSGTVLGVGKPIVLGYDNGAGLTFERRLDIDDSFMITVTDKVTNSSAAAVTLAPYANVERIGRPTHIQTNATEGAVGAFSKDDTGKDYRSDPIKSFANWEKKAPKPAVSRGGWIGITDKYWLTAVIPDQKTRIHAAFNVQGKEAQAFYQAGYVTDAFSLAPGASQTLTNRIFAGAKLDAQLQAYGKTYGIPMLNNAIDWGNYFFWVSKPIFWVLDNLSRFFNNFGMALLCLTVIIRGIFYPFAHKQYESSIKMKAVMPQMEAIKLRFKDDPQKQQQELAALYQKEKLNPVAGCLPMLLQLPVFLALSKVFFVTIEMRQTPFFGLLKDLSSRDPTSIWNLFGLLPYLPAQVPLLGGLLDGVLHVGIWSVIYGATFYLTMSMTPMATTDPMQKRIFQFMPIIIPFFMASLPVGLLIYYSWSSLLTVAQQYLIMRSYKVENPIDTLIGKLMGKKPLAVSSGGGKVEVLPPIDPPKKRTAKKKPDAE
jgi:YidC/Oxa1 family membrane protein insertase